MYTKTQFYPKLKGKRNELGYTLEEMSKLIGISKNAYFKKEKGKTPNRNP